MVAAREFWPGESFTLLEVRAATLADFIVPANVVGDVREQMAEKVGTDGLLEEAIQGGTFDPDDFGAELKVFVDAYAEAKGFTLEGVTVLVRSRDVQPE